MFSLSAAKILDNDANETNYKFVFNQLTGLNLTDNGKAIQKERSLMEEAEDILVQRMGGGA